jgi:hypothetical protein
MHAVSEDQIRLKAYEMWEADGRPHGNDQDYWFRSAQALETIPAAKPAKRTRTTTRKAKAA